MTATARRRLRIMSGWYRTAVALWDDRPRPMASGNDTALFPALLDLIRQHTGGPPLAYADPPTPLRGGFWAEIHAFRLAEPPPGFAGDLVVRIMPDGTRATRDGDARRRGAAGI